MCAEVTHATSQPQGHAPLGSHTVPTASSYTCTQVLRPGRTITLGALTLRLAAATLLEACTWLTLLLLPPPIFKLLRLKLPPRLLPLLLVVRLNTRRGWLTLLLRAGAVAAFPPLLVLPSTTAAASWSVKLRRCEGLSLGFSIVSKASLRLWRAAEAAPELLLLALQPPALLTLHLPTLTLLRPNAAGAVRPNRDALTAVEVRIVDARLAATAAAAREARRVAAAAEADSEERRTAGISPLLLLLLAEELSLLLC